MVALAEKLPDLMNVEAFLAWEPPDQRQWQLVDGEPRAKAPANRTHAALMMQIGHLRGNHFEAPGSPCSVLGAPGVKPRVRADLNVRIPDLAVTCSGYHTEESVLTDPVLLIEILSPSNQSKTWTNVWAYTTIPSVREILVLKSASIGADVLRRMPDGTWPERPETIEDGDLVLESVGFRVPLADLYGTTRPAAARG